MQKSTRALIVLCLLLGLSYHAAIIFRQRKLLSDRPFRDDSFYALTVARNLADGRGLTVADGQIRTNGIQPLFVYVSAIPYLMTSDPYAALRYVQVIHLLVHALSVLVLFRLIRRFSTDSRAPWIGSALWACSYNILTQVTNGLETGLYLLMIQLVILFYMKYFLETAAKLASSAAFGILLGLATLTRIDAGFLCVGIGIHYVSLGRLSVRRFLLGPVVWFAGWAAATMPWWLYNIGLTGSPLPTSGLVQTMYDPDTTLKVSSEILRNLWYAVQVVLDHMILVGFTPLRMIGAVDVKSLAVLLTKLLVVVLFLRSARNAWRGDAFPICLKWRGMGFYYLYLLLLLAFYVLVFTVEWYMNRYLIPVAVLSAILVPLSLRRMRPVCAQALLLICLLFTLAFGAYSYTRATDSTYADHWGWVRDHLDDTTWVAAGQAGILGYYHQRTINTDGKVNTEIFGIRLGDRGSYLCGRGVRYFIEWDGDIMFYDSSFKALYEPFDRCGRSLVYRMAE